MTENAKAVPKDGPGAHVPKPTAPRKPRAEECANPLCRGMARPTAAHVLTISQGEHHWILCGLDCAIAWLQLSRVAVNAGRAER